MIKYVHNILWIDSHKKKNAAIYSGVYLLPFLFGINRVSIETVSVSGGSAGICSLFGGYSARKTLVRILATGKTIAKTKDAMIKRRAFFAALRLASLSASFSVAAFFNCSFSFLCSLYASCKRSFLSFALSNCFFKRSTYFPMF